MTVYIGVDFHPYEQSVAFADDSDGEIGYRRFLHSDKQSIKAFYRQLGQDALIGVEASGCLWWFEKLLATNGQKLKIGENDQTSSVIASQERLSVRGDDPGSSDARAVPFARAAV
jgi:hypothetical protein